MSSVIAWGIAIVAVVAGFLLVRATIWTFWKYRGDRVVTCPENQRPAGVHVDLQRAAQAALRGSQEIRLDTCSRWPERQNCGQACLAQIEQSPEDCMVRNILVKWYADKQCVCCGKPIGAIHLTDHHPGLLSPAKKLVAWPEIAPETLPSVLESHLPVCWNCVIVQSMIVQHPELVLDRARKS